MEARDEDADDGMPGGTMGGGGGGRRWRWRRRWWGRRKWRRRDAAFAQLRDHGGAPPAVVAGPILRAGQGRNRKPGPRSSEGAAAARPGVTRIPVVVHVVWNTAAQNISDAQIASQIDVLNRDFRRTNPDVNNTPAAFLPLTADCQGRVLPCQCRSERRSHQRDHPSANNRCIVRFQRCDQVSGDRRHQRMARGPLSQHVGRASSQAGCSATRNSPAEQPRPTAWSFFIPHSAPSAPPPAVPSRPYRDPRNRPLVEPQPHLGR